jgi:hypothetical protein
MVSAPAAVPLVANRPLAPLFSVPVPHGDIKRGDELAHIGDAVGGVLDQQRVGAAVDRDTAAARQQRLATRTLRLHQRRDVLGLGVVDLQVFGAQRGQILDVLAGGQRGLLAIGQLFGGADDDHVVLHALVEALQLQHQVEHMVPGNAVDAQRDAALHRVGDEDVLAALVSNELQQRAGFDVLEVGAHALARVDGLFFGGSLGHAARLHLDHVLVVGLVGQLLEITGGRQHHLRAGWRAQRVEAADGRGEVGNVEAALQVLRQVGADEVHEHLVALLVQVDRRARIAELDDQPAGGRAVIAAAEVQVLDGPTTGAGGCCGGSRCSAGRRGGRNRGTRRFAQRHDDLVALDAGLVRQHVVKVQHQARAAIGFGGQHAVETAVAHVDAALGQSEPGVRQIEGNARGVVDGERQRLRCRAAGGHHQLHAVAGQRLHVHGLQFVGRGIRGDDRGYREQTGCSAKQGNEQGSKGFGDSHITVHSLRLPANHSFSDNWAARSI